MPKVPLSLRRGDPYVKTIDKPSCTTPMAHRVCKRDARYVCVPDPSDEIAALQEEIDSIGPVGEGSGNLDGGDPTTNFGGSDPVEGGGP